MRQRKPQLKTRYRSRPSNDRGEFHAVDSPVNLLRVTPEEVAHRAVVRHLLRERGC